MNELSCVVQQQLRMEWIEWFWSNRIGDRDKRIYYSVSDAGVCNTTQHIMVQLKHEKFLVLHKPRLHRFRTQIQIGSSQGPTLQLLYSNHDLSCNEMSIHIPHTHTHIAGQTTLTIHLSF